MAKKTYTNFSMKLVQKATNQLDRAFISADWTKMENLLRFQKWVKNLDNRTEKMIELAKEAERLEKLQREANAEA